MVNSSPMDLDDAIEIARSVPDATRPLPGDALAAAVRAVAGPAGARVSRIGRSGEGRPIELVSFGQGAPSVLAYAYPHPDEPVGGATVLFLAERLAAGDARLARAPVRSWHLIPCVDPDGAARNEGWLEALAERGGAAETILAYGRAGYRPIAPADEVDWSVAEPHPETEALLRALASVRPDAVLPLHDESHAPAPATVGAAPALGKPDLERVLGALRAFGQPVAPDGPCDLEQVAAGEWAVSSFAFAQTANPEARILVTEIAGARVQGLTDPAPAPIDLAALDGWVRALASRILATYVDPARAAAGDGAGAGGAADPRLRRSVEALAARLEAVRDDGYLGPIAGLPAAETYATRAEETEAKRALPALWLARAGMAVRLLGDRDLAARLESDLGRAVRELAPEPIAFGQMVRAQVAAVLAFL